MKILVTGGTGFVGKHLVKRLVNEGNEVSCLVRQDSEFLKNLGVSFYKGDINDEIIKDAVKDKEIIYHLVGIGDVSATSKEAYEEYKEVNVEGTRSLLEACISNKNLRKIICFSSTAAMGLLKGSVDETSECNPVTPYQKSKFESEKVILDYYKKYNLPVVILRPSMIYGKEARNSQIFEIYKFIKKGFVPLIGKGDNNVPLVHVSDVVEATLLAGEKGNNGEVYIITNSEIVTLKQLIRGIKEVSNKKAITIKIPKKVALILAFGIERIKPIITRKRIKSMTTNRIFNTEKAFKEMGWKSKIELKEGISLTLK
tara:strand:+ start:353 stop:1294 length:942 start_codon:yes stop_codon:yes gene_type:complete